MRKEYCKSAKKILKTFNNECWSTSSGRQMKDTTDKHDAINDRLYYL